MLRSVIYASGLMLAWLAGRAIADACIAIDEALSLPEGPPEPPQPARVRVIIVRVGEAPGDEEAV